MTGFGIAHKSLIDAGTAKFIRVTATPISHQPLKDGGYILILVPVLTGLFRDLIRTACGTRARFPSVDLVAEAKQQPLIRYGVHVHHSSGNPSSCVGAYKTHKIITFSSDGLFDSGKVDSGGCVDRTKTSTPITFKVEKLDTQLASNTLHLDSENNAVILPTVLSGADILHRYLSTCLASPLVKSDDAVMKTAVAAHFALDAVSM